MEFLQFFLRDLLVSDTTDLHSQAKLLVHLIAIAWSLHLINWGFAGGGLSYIFGVRPRTITGLLGIVGAHFLHFVRKNAQNQVIDGRHIISNTLAFAPLGWLITLQGINFFYIVSIAVMLSSGLGTWLFGQDESCHAGASGVVYGYIGFLLLFGLTSGQMAAFLMALLVLWLYGGSINGLLPVYRRLYFLVPGFILAPIIYVLRPLKIIAIDVRVPISWEMHLFGFAGGALMGLAMSDLKLSLS